MFDYYWFGGLLGLFYISWALLSGRALFSYGLAVVSFVFVASLSTLVEIWVGLDSNLTMSFLAGFLVLAAMTSQFKTNLSSRALTAVSGGVLTGAVAALSTYMSRTFGFSSIGFTDGHTILLRSIEFANGEPSTESGVKALKRGFGISAIHAQGSETEYLVGFMPLVFLAAVISTGLLVWQISNSRYFAITATLFVIAITPIVEAIGRQVWLINSHSLLWLIFTLLTLLFYEYRKDPNASMYKFIAVLALFGTVGFLRVDAILITLPFTLLFMSVFHVTSTRYAYAIIPIQAVTGFLWIVTVTDEFPLFGLLGPYLFLLAGLLVPILFLRFDSVRLAIDSAFGKKLFWYLLAIFVVYSIFAIDFGTTFRALLNNLYLGQALWGGLPYLVTAVFLVAIIFWRGYFGSKDRVIISVFVLSILSFVVIKSWDSLDQGVLYGGVSRTGFGDSLNRNLISWTPLVLIVVSAYMRSFNPFANVKSQKSAD